MLSTVKVFHPDITSTPQTYLGADYNSGTSLTVANGTVFTSNDYIVVDSYGSQQSEIGQILTPGSTSMALVGALQFSHQNDSTITRIPYNQFEVHRSTTGIGGVYTLLGTGSFAVSQPDFTTYIDNAGNTAYSYKVRYTNTTSGITSSFGPEMPTGGYPFYSLGSIEDRVLELYVDSSAEFISRKSISDWCNELLGRVNRSVTDSESALFATFTTFKPGSTEYTDISTYNMESIILVEYSTDGGVSYLGNINPMDSRIKSDNSTSDYAWKLIGDNMFIYSGQGFGSSGQFPANNMVRVWYFTQQPTLSMLSDLLPVAYRSYSDTFVDYCMMRANEQSRRLTESASYYYKKLFTGTRDQPASVPDLVNSVRSRIDQGNKAMATTWLNGF